MSAHIPTTETTRGETFGACSCGWSTTHGYSGDIAWRETRAMNDAQEHANEFGPLWETCAGCGREFQYPHLCRKHMLCGICHEGVER